MNQLGRNSSLTEPDSNTELLIADDGPLIADTPGCFQGRDFTVGAAAIRADTVALQRDPNIHRPWR